MSTERNINEKMDRKSLFSTLWIFLAVNYIYCDHLGLMEPGVVSGLMAGQIGSIPITQIFLLAAALIIGIPFMMIVLSRVLKHRINRWVNMIAGLIMIIIQIGTLNVGTAPSLVYYFYSTIEVITNLVIIILAWRWHNPES
jgi:predicted tellurium resistance membrane protein TerC